MAEIESLLALAATEALGLERIEQLRVASVQEGQIGLLGARGGGPEDSDSLTLRTIAKVSD